jgi:hypothetical protein
MGCRQNNNLHNTQQAEQLRQPQPMHSLSLYAMTTLFSNRDFLYRIHLATNCYERPPQNEVINPNVQLVFNIGKVRLQIAGDRVPNEGGVSGHGVAIQSTLLAMTFSAVVGFIVHLLGEIADVS